MNPEKGHIRIAAVVLALIVVVAVVAVMAMPRDISVEKEGDGTLSFEGEKSLRAFGSLEIDIEPGDGCIAKVYLDGDEVASGVTSYRYDAPFADFSKHEIRVVFERSAPVPGDKATLTVERGEGGSVDPDGAKEVAKGSTQTIRITPDEGYVIDEIRIDGGIVPICNVVDVRMDADRTVSISFRPVAAQDVAVTIDVDAQIEIRTTGGEIDFGKIIPDGEVKVKPGSSLKITVLLNPGFEMKDFSIDGKSVGKVSEYTIENIQASVDVSISVVKQVDGYTITATAGSGGKISPSGETAVEKGKDATFTFSANSGYAVSEVTVDGKKVSATGSYTFEAVSSDHTISVTFKYIGGGGSVTLTKIGITEQPTRTEYISGESFDAAGMEVTATYSDGTSKVVTDYTVSPAGPLTSSVKSITVSYGGRTCTQAIAVYDLDSISVDATNCRTSYLVGDCFDATGLVVTAHYGSIHKTIDDYEYSPSGALTTVGEVTITITFEGETDSFDISVVEPTSLTGIVITEGPAKDHYFDDQLFEKNGMVVSGQYTGGVMIPLSIADVEISESDGTVTVRYQDKEATCEVVRDYKICDASELEYFRDKVNDGTTYKDLTITLDADIDLKDEPWIPIGLNADDPKKFMGTFEGSNRTISNLIIDTAAEKKYQATGFFGALNGKVQNLTFRNATITGFSGGNETGGTDNGIAVVAGSIYNSGRIVNVKVDGATVTGNRYIGAISGYVYGSITGCSVSNATIIATPDKVGDKYDNGDKVGGIAGYLGEGSHKITGCSVSNSSISGYRNLGGIVGAAHQAPESCTVGTITILHTRDVIADEPSSGNQSGVIAGTRVGSAAPTSNTVSGRVITDDIGVLSTACTYAGSSTVTIELMNGTYTPSSKRMTVLSGKDIVLQPAADQGEVVFDGQILVTGKLTVSSIRMNTAYEIEDISQFRYSGVAVESEGEFVADNVTFVETLSQSTAITAYWSKGNGTTISVSNCTFECNGNRPIRSDCSVTVQNCIFNDQYRYSVQLTSKAGTVSGIDKASVIFKGNTINAGSTSSKPVYGVQLEGSEYGCGDLAIEGSGNTIDYGDTKKTGAMYYCDCGKVDHDTISWNTESDPIHKSYIYVASEDELLKIGNGLSANQSDYKNKTIVLMKDLDMKDKQWPVINLNNGVGSLRFIGYGDGITISNLKLGAVAVKDGYSSVGFIASTGSMKSLSFENISLEGLDTGDIADSKTNAVGAFIGYAGTSDRITISDCKVLKSEISGGHWAGGFVGYAAGYSDRSNGPVFEVLTIEGCMIENSTISSPGSAGGIIGHATGDAWTRDEINSCTVKGCTITSTGTDIDKAGSLMGTVGAGQSIYGKDGGVFVESCEVDGCTVQSNGSDIHRIYGRQGTIGGVLCVDGSYIFFDDNNLKAAIDSGKGKILIPSGDYELPTNLNGKTINIIGQSTDTTIVTVPQNVLEIKDVTFENVTLKIENGNYQGFNNSENAVFRNCVLEGQFFLYGPSVQFHGCTFKQSDSDSYNVWTYTASDVLFSKCTFESAGRSVLIYNEGGEKSDMTITFEECVMTASSPVAGKAAVEVDASLFNHSCTVEIDKSTAEHTSGFGDGSNSGSNIWNNKKDPTKERVKLTISVDGKDVLSKTKTA